MRVKIVMDRYELKNGKKVLKQEETCATKVGDVEKAVRELDGNMCSMVTFFKEEDANLCVSGGGDDGRYLVTVNYGIDDAFFTLLTSEHLNGSEIEHEVPIIVGGQEVTKAKGDLVGLDATIRAAKHWARESKMLQSLKWRQDE